MIPVLEAAAPLQALSHRIRSRVGMCLRENCTPLHGMDAQ